jgi:putative spermidine/putrescine transport system permease protein
VPRFDAVADAARAGNHRHWQLAVAFWRGEFAAHLSPGQSPMATIDLPSLAQDAPVKHRRAPAWLQATPLSLTFLLFFIVPLVITLIVSFWDFNEYQIIPAFTLKNYAAIFNGCSSMTDICVTFKTYWSTLKFCAIVWTVTLLLGFSLAYFLAFHVRTTSTQTVLFLLCTIPFWTSNVIRMISWMPLLGRNGLINQGLLGAHLIDQPLEWLLYSNFSVVLAFVHLYTFFMIVPIFNAMMRIDRSLLEAARDAGASGWQVVRDVVLPLSKTGIVIGSIFVITIVMGDFLTVGVMGGQQIASVGKIIQVQTGYLQFPAAAANAIILLAVVLMIVWGLTRVVDIRKEL